MSTDGAGQYGHHRHADPFVQADRDSSAFVRLDRVYKVHRVGNVGVAALGGVSFEVAKGEFAAIVGPSGAGKSTILNLIGGVDTPTAGLVSVGGADLAQLGATELSEYRRRMVGFLWQGTTKNLIPYLTVAQNAELPLLLAGIRPSVNRRRRTAYLLEFMGLAERANHLPAMLSGGEQQRAGLVVALAHEPAVVLADEPTAEIDAEGADQVVKALRAACAELGATVVMATHDLVAAAKADLTFRLIDGRVRGPAGRATIDSSGRITLPGAATSLLGSTAAELEVELEGDEIRIRRFREAIGHGWLLPSGSTARMTVEGPGRSPCKTSRFSSRRASWWPSWGHRARERAPCSASPQDSNHPTAES
jgi:ABC-type lipoprotein export system ATPase subunit